ncbi:hypothetical protein [Streptomyces sp. RerS4]|uniref:hypothetical protein n=1 Tax=Streptomyces sp. RerS4 TaxID=2942449 RepID=UPI00201C8628|nr:hypothetical protein [Streptomyces sp. RerS4]UQX04463.1 hypothetical protein M4D82_31125 [Streptomyces sp. RerS4]
MTPPAFHRVRWTSALTLAVLGAGTVRARRRLRAIPVLPAPPSGAAGLPRAAGWRLLTARGVEADPATFLAACAYADRMGLRVLDLLPVDLAAERALGLLRLVDPDAYREDRLGEGRGAGYAVLVSEDVLARAGVDEHGTVLGATDGAPTGRGHTARMPAPGSAPGGSGSAAGGSGSAAGLEPAQLLALTRRLKEYAADSTGLAIAPALSVGRVEPPPGAVRAAESRAQGLPPGPWPPRSSAGWRCWPGSPRARAGGAPPRPGCTGSSRIWCSAGRAPRCGPPICPGPPPPGRCAPSARVCVPPARSSVGPPARLPTPPVRPRTGPNWAPVPIGSWSRSG